MFEVAGHPESNPFTDAVGARGRIALVDNHLLFIEAMEFALAKSDLLVVGVAPCGEEAINMVRTKRPDVVLLGLLLPDRQGIELGERMMAMAPGMRVIGMSAGHDRVTIRGLRRAGFHGFFPKASPVASVVKALKSKDPEASWLMSPESENGADVDPRLSRLTPRERDVLALLGKGLPASTIAMSLGISTNTARSHIQNILTKLHVHTRLEAVAVVLAAHG